MDLSLTEVDKLQFLGQLVFFQLTMNMRFIPQVNGTTTFTVVDTLNKEYSVSIKHETLCGPSEASYGQFLDTE